MDPGESLQQVVSLLLPKRNYNMWQIRESERVPQDKFRADDMKGITLVCKDMIKFGGMGICFARR